MEAVWSFIETTLSNDLSLRALCPVSFSNGKMIQRGFYTLPNRFDAMVTYLGITSVEEAPTERHTYRLTAWTSAATNSPDLVCSRVMARLSSVFSGKSFIEDEFVVVNTEMKSKDEGAVYDESLAAWRMDMVVTFILVKR